MSPEFELSKFSILESDDLPREKVPTPEWPKAGGHVWVKALNATERDAFEALIYDVNAKTPKMNRENIRATLCAMTLCNSKGERLFTDNEIGVLGLKSSVVLDRIFKVAQRLSALTDNEVRAAAKNSDPDQSAS